MSHSMAGAPAGAWSLAGTVEFLVASVAFALAARMLYNYYNGEQGLTHNWQFVNGASCFLATS